MDAITRPETRSNTTAKQIIAEAHVADEDDAIRLAEEAEIYHRTVSTPGLARQIARRDVCHAIGLRALKLAGQPGAKRADLMAAARTMIEIVEYLDDEIDGGW